MISLRRAALVAALLLPAFSGMAQDRRAPLAEVNGIRVENGVARATSAAARAGAGYFRLVNTGEADDRLLEIRSPSAERTQLHDHEVRDGIARMLPLDAGLDLPAGEAVELAPGGLHAMFMGLGAAWREGAEIPLTLVFEKAGAVEIVLPVEIGAPAAHPHGG